MRERVSLRLLLAPAGIVILAAATARGAVLPPAVGTLEPAGIMAQASSVLTIANLDALQPTTSIVAFARQPMGDRTQYVPPLIAPLEALDIDPACDVPLPLGAYAARTEADRIIASQALTAWPSSGAMAAYEQSRPGTDVLVPLVMKHRQRRDSLVTVQNTSPSDGVTATVELVASGVVTPVRTLTLPLPPGGSRTLDLTRDSELFPADQVPDGFLGWLRFQADTPVAVQSFVDVADQTLAVWAFEGLPVEDAAEHLFVPKFTRAAAAETTLVLLNHHPAPVDVTVDFLGWEGRCVNEAYSVTRTLAAGEVALLGGQAGEIGTPLPEDCSASVVVRAEAPLTGLAVDRDQVIADRFPVRLEAAYLASGTRDAARRILVPAFRRTFPTASSATSGRLAGENAGSQSPTAAWGPRSSALFAMNVGPATATATLELFDAAGRQITTCGDACVADIGPYATHPWLATELDALPDGTDGRALLRSDQPLVVAVAEAGGITDLAILRGMAVPESNRVTAAQLPRALSFVPSFFAAGCERPTATATPDGAITPTATEPTEPSPTPDSGPSPTPACSQHDTEMSLSASATELRVGELVTVTARLQNVGCGMVGLLLYRLEREPGRSLAAVSPLTVSHPIGLVTGQADEAQFTFRGVRNGTESLRARVSFEVHLGYPGPAYWAGDGAGPLTIRVRELRTYLPFAALRQESPSPGP